MATTFTQWARLIKLIILNRKTGGSSHDFHIAREVMLKNLGDFCPSPIRTKNKVPDIAIAKFPFIRRLMHQGAFVKQALATTGGHLFVPELNLAYIRIPKAANTSVSYVMLKACYPELKKHRLTDEQINFLTDRNLLKTIAKPEKSAVYFTLVRDPFARVVSVYRHFFERESQHFIYDDYLFGILKKDLSFAAFVTTLASIPDVLKDQHLRPQHSFLTYYLRKGCDVKILHLEDNEQVGNFLQPYDLTLSRLNENPGPADYRTYYDAATAKKVYDLYAADIQHLGYEKSYETLMKALDEKDRSKRVFNRL